MKIQNIKVYKINIPLKEGSYKWAHNNHVEKFDTSIVVIETDNNILGLGEVCTLGSSLSIIIPYLLSLDIIFDLPA